MNIDSSEVVIAKDMASVTHQRDLYAEALNRVRTRLWAIHNSPGPLRIFDLGQLCEALWIIEGALRDNEGRDAPKSDD